MGCKKMPGLYKRNEVWHIDKKIFGRRLYESTGTGDLDEATNFLVRRIEELRQEHVFGVRPKRSFQEAATKYLLDNQGKKSIHCDAYRLKGVVKYIGHVALDELHMGVLQPFIDARRQSGAKSRTINHDLKVVRHVLNLTTEWIDEFGLSWLQHAPKIKVLPEHDLRQPYPLSWDEQERLFSHLPEHLRQMATFAVNTGCRDAVVCGLRWDWEIFVPELNANIFFVPSEAMKMNRDHVVVLNGTARAVIEKRRGIHPEYVFTFKGNPVTKMTNTGWKQARELAGIPQVRVHDLRHTFGRRLRAAGVSLEDREDLLGHKSSRMTTHYSAAELSNLLAAVNKVCQQNGNTPVLTLLRRNKVTPIAPFREKSNVRPANLPQGEIYAGGQKARKPW